MGAWQLRNCHRYEFGSFVHVTLGHMRGSCRQHQEFNLSCLCPCWVPDIISRQYISLQADVLFTLNPSSDANPLSPEPSGFVTLHAFICIYSDLLAVHQCSMLPRSPSKYMSERSSSSFGPQIPRATHIAKMDVSDVSPTPALCPYVFTLKRPARVALSPDSLPSMHFRRSCYVLPTSRIVRGIVSSSVKWSTSCSADDAWCCLL